MIGQVGGANKGINKGDGHKSSKAGNAACGASGIFHKGGKSMCNEKCFYCGCLGHFQADCDEMKNDIKTGYLKVNPEGKLQLRDGTHIPGFPSGMCIKERAERHYVKSHRNIIMVNMRMKIVCCHP